MCPIGGRGRHSAQPFRTENSNGKAGQNHRLRSPPSLANEMLPTGRRKSQPGRGTVKRRILASGKYSYIRPYSRTSMWNYYQLTPRIRAARGVVAGAPRSPPLTLDRQSSISTSTWPHSPFINDEYVWPRWSTTTCAADARRSALIAYAACGEPARKQSVLRPVVGGRKPEPRSAYRARKVAVADGLCRRRQSFWHAGLNHRNIAAIAQLRPEYPTVSAHAWAHFLTARRLFRAQVIHRPKLLVNWSRYTFSPSVVE